MKSVFLGLLMVLSVSVAFGVTKVKRPVDNTGDVNLDSSFGGWCQSNSWSLYPEPGVSNDDCIREINAGSCNFYSIDREYASSGGCQSQYNNCTSTRSGEYWYMHCEN